MHGSAYQFPQPARERLRYPAQGRQGPAFQVLSVPQSWGHHPIRKQCGWQREISQKPQLQATLPWDDLGAVVCFQKTSSPQLGSKVVY